MEFSVNLGIWSSVFAVPKQIVDNYIKLAGATQLKVILWILSKGGEKFSSDDIAKAIGKSEDDVNDALQFWCELGILDLGENDISLLENKSELQIIENNISNSEVQQKNETTKTRITSRTIAPDVTYVNERINSSKEISDFMQYAQAIFGRPISPDAYNKILMMHENDGLPFEVISMILQYAVSNGKGMRYIEKMGIDWGEEEIFTVEMAEEKLRKLEENKKYAYIVQRLFNQSNHIPTKNEEERATRWFKDYNFSEEIIKYAYDLCMDSLGKYQANYIDKILVRWHNNNLKSIDEINKYNNAHTKQQKRKEKDEISYDIEEYEKYDIFDN